MRLGWLGACLLVWASAPAQAEPQCGPAVQVSGDAAEVARVVSILEGRGLRAPAADCPATKARVVRVERQLFVEVEDALGRQNRRIVSTEEAAATVIESWAYDALSGLDLEIPVAAPVVPAPTTERPLDLALPPLVAALPPPVALPAPLPPRPTEEGLAFSWRDVDGLLFSDLSIGGGGVLWYGIGLSATTTRGPLQLGITARASRRSDFALVLSPSAAPPGALTQCTPVDLDGDGETDRLDCAGGCSIEDLDADGQLDDQSCTNDATGCTSVDLGQDGVIDDFQCELPPGCLPGELSCDPTSPLLSPRSQLSLQGEAGLPLRLRGLSVIPALGMGLTRVGAEGLSQVLFQGEALLDLSRVVRPNLALDLRLACNLVPGLPSAVGQSSFRAAVGLRWLRGR